MSDDSNVTFHYHSGLKGEFVLTVILMVAILSFFAGRWTVPPSAEEIAHKQEMERLRSEESARQAEVVAEALALSTTMATETMMMVMDADGKIEIPDVEVPLEGAE